MHFDVLPYIRFFSFNNPCLSRVFFVAFSHQQAVKRSRVKSKARTQETEDRVKWLRTNNKVMEEKIEKHQKDLKFLKDLFLAQAQTKAQTVTTEDLKKLLQSDDSDDDDGNQGSSTRA